MSFSYFRFDTTIKPSEQKGMKNIKSNKKGIQPARHKLLPEQQQKLLKVLKARFERNMNRHKSLEWAKVEAKMASNPEKLWSLNEMERTGGEPDVVGYHIRTDEYIFNDCSAESPSRRRSLCYDRAALESNLQNQISFLSSCKSAGILPAKVFHLTAVNSAASPLHILFVTGTYDALIKYFEMFYLPMADSIFEKLFHSQNWNLINAESSVGNVAQKGYGITSLDSLDQLLKRIRYGEYMISKII